MTSVCSLDLGDEDAGAWGVDDALGGLVVPEEVVFLGEVGTFNFGEGNVGLEDRL